MEPDQRGLRARSALQFFFRLQNLLPLLPACPPVADVAGCSSVSSTEVVPTGGSVTVTCSSGLVFNTQEASRTLTCLSGSYDVDPATLVCQGRKMEAQTWPHGCEWSPQNRSRRRSR